MRRARFGVVASGLFLTTIALWAAGCGKNADNCANNLDGVCPSFDPSGNGGGGGGPPAPPPACTGDPTADPALVREECGVFVWANAPPAGDGTIAKPFRTLQDAFNGAEKDNVTKWIFACNDGQFSDAVTIARTRQLYGGFDCTQSPSKWSYTDQQKTVLEAPSGTVGSGADDVIALRISSGANGTIVDSFSINADAAAKSGGSSIAVLVDSVINIELRRSDLVAGAGKDGDSGAPIPADSNLDGSSGDKGIDVCTGSAANPGANSVTKSCMMSDGSSIETIGGRGGDGGNINGTTLEPAGNGENGSPLLNNPNGGTGEGQPGATACINGVEGLDGADGKSGAGAKGMGTISFDGYEGLKASPGIDGKPGQGGGGGGGSKGGLMVSCNGGSPIARVGASGSSGGTGGCGGRGGNPGVAGGSSIALLSVNANVKLVGAVNLTANSAGKGGDGGLGQDGGQPGPGGVAAAGASGAKASCAGADGGHGGGGGQGGGGQGGHSLGIAYLGPLPEISMSTKIVRAMAGGTGGTGADTAGKGADGVAGDTLEFK